MLGGVEVLSVGTRVRWGGKVIYRLQMFARTTEYQIRVDMTIDCCSIDP